MESGVADVAYLVFLLVLGYDLPKQCAQHLGAFDIARKVLFDDKRIYHFLVFYELRVDFTNPRTD